MPSHLVIVAEGCVEQLAQHAIDLHLMKPRVLPEPTYPAPRIVAQVTLHHRAAAILLDQALALRTLMKVDIRSNRFLK